MHFQEQANLHFYAWELRTRGYHIFDNIVELEPPFVPYVPYTHPDTRFDDGKRGWLGLFPHKKPQITEPALPETTACYAEDIPDINSFEIFFTKGTEPRNGGMEELLRYLQYSQSTLSYEIIAQHGRIEIRITSSGYDSIRIQSHLRALYPNIIIKDVHPYHLSLDPDDPDIAICDYGLNHEGMFPLNTNSYSETDSLTSLIAIMESISEHEYVMFQVLFKGVTAPWAEAMKYAVDIGDGTSFFANVPELPKITEEKTKDTLYAVIVRTVCRGSSIERSNYLNTQLAQSLSILSKSEHNSLIPLSNVGYPYTQHLMNVARRTSHRSGMLLNLQELVHLAHFPSDRIASTKLSMHVMRKTKAVHQQALDASICIGVNEHEAQTTEVCLSLKQRLMHMTITGASGVGKSSLIAHMILADFNAQVGAALIDPHGDLVDDVLKGIPPERIKNVILIDASDTDFPIGFNIFEAATEAEKMVLSSDIVATFKQFSTSWGDTIEAVLQNAVNTMLDSDKEASLIDMKRFLIESKFREQFLASVSDPTLLYYWHHEFPLVSKRISPLLTRIDTFLRPKIVRSMLVQKQSIHLRRCMDEGKLILIKLAQGNIGEECAYMLGEMMLAKFNQAALSRQDIPKDQRKPFFLYCDEFQNYISKSIVKILSGTRKFGLGLILAHQDLSQIANKEVLNSFLSNPYTRICFRLGDDDAKQLDAGFSYFNASDLQELGKGEAIVRIGSRAHDCNLTTFPPSAIDEGTRDAVIAYSRANYARPRHEVEEILASMLPRIATKDRQKKQPKETTALSSDIATSLPQDTPPTQHNTPDTSGQNTSESASVSTSFDEQKHALLQRHKQEQDHNQHRSIQKYVQALGQQRNFKAEIEKKTNTGQYIDVFLSNEKMSIAVEVSVTNSIDYEVQNIKKCIEANATWIYVIAESATHRKNIQKRAQAAFDTQDLKKISFGTPSSFVTFIDGHTEKPASTTKRVRGYQVTSRHINLDQHEAQARHTNLQKIITQSRKSGDTWG